MAQHDYNIANQGFPAFRSDLNNALSAIQTNNSGTSRPTGAVAGQIWLDTTNSTSPTLKFFDGSDDISLATINYTANTVDWLDSSVTITGLSTTATGTVLTLSDTASTSSVNLIIDNQKEVRFRETTANGTNYVALKAPASLASDVTFTLPSADGTANQVLTTNGSGVLSFATVGGIAWQSVQTTGFTAVASRAYPCNTTSSAFTVTLPASATAGDTIILVDYAGTFATNALTLGANGLKINGSTDNKRLSTNREAVTITYVDSTQGWVASSGVNEGTQSLDSTSYSIDFLVVAGGGSGGGGNVGAGGGAGGYRTSTQTATIGNTITVTVGDGGASATTTTGNNGSDSSISGTGLTTITSTGGGGGGSSISSGAGKNGGSGGGSGATNIAGSGIGLGNTPSTSPSQGNNGGLGWDGTIACTLSGGGGGAGAVGGNSSQTCSPPTAGNGGNGTASSITGSSVTRAGGGGGQINQSPYTGGSGGTGGGGAGGTHTPATNGTAGTANTGGGGGGASGSPYTSGAGGKGVVILSVPTANYSGTSTGSPTVTTSGSNTILTFNGSGSYTA
jgi:hypothetical protein